MTIHLYDNKSPVPARRFLRHVALLVAALGILAAQALAETETFDVRELSNPPGLITARTTTVEAGATHRVHPFPVVSGDHRFGFWTFNGVRQAFPNGQAYLYPEATVIAEVEAVAHFFPAAEDGDGDRLADWWEFWMFGDRSRGPHGDDDGDGVAHEEEFRHGYSARFTDNIPSGGLSSRLSAPLRLIVRNRLTYTLRSEPLGLVSADGELSPGQSYTTPHLLGDTSGFTFVGFEVDGQPVPDATGHYLNRITVTPTADTEIMARYVLAGSDSDGDGIPDAVEYQNFGSLNYGREDDPDGDGFTVGKELDLGLSLVTSDSAVSGGISSRLSAPLDYDRIRSRYIVESMPLGLILGVDELVMDGTERTSPHIGAQLVSGYAFAYWSVNGERVAGPDGVARRQVHVTVNEPTTLVAHFFEPGADTDADGLVDWWEWNLLGVLDYDAQSDTDGDGITIGEEQRLGFAVAHVDQLINGGLSTRLSAPLNYENGTRKRLLVRSQPLGIVPSTDQHMDAGSEVISQRYTFRDLYSGYHFTHWTRNDVRVSDDAGHSRNQVVFDLTEETELVAHFTLPHEDLDEDGIFDFLELRLAGNLITLDPDSDLDGDGFTVAEERRHGMALLLRDEVLDGGISARLSAPAGLQFSVPPLDLMPDRLQTVQGAPAGARVGNLSVRPAEPGRTYTFSLLMGEGGDDNSRFTLEGNELQLAATLDSAPKRFLNVRVRATDDLGISRSWPVVVQAHDSLLTPLSLRVVDEEQQVVVEPRIGVPEMSDEVAVISLVSAPPGSNYDAAAGHWSWTPGEADGPGAFEVTFRADNGVMISDQTFTVAVREVNRAPVLEPIAELSATPDEELSFVASASDADLPANSLAFSLENAPAGTSIDASTGVFAWTPSTAHADSTFFFQVSVFDGLASDSIDVVVRIPAAAGLAESWLNDRFTGATPPERRGLLDDANGDGVSNLMAYALGIHPESPEALAYPALVRDDQGGVRLVLRARANDAALSSTIRTSADLKAWSAHSLTFDAGGGQWTVEGSQMAIASATDIGDGVWEIQLTLQQGAPSSFWRMDVDYNP